MNSILDQAVILIPARFHSSRFPGKPLALIKDAPMIQHVYQNMILTGLPVYIVTDDSRIEETVIDFGGQVIRINDEVHSGTDRIFLAYDRFLRSRNFKYIINVQGDEPLLKAQEIMELLEFHKDTSFDITTMVHKKSGSENLKSFENPNAVKVIYNENDRTCHYFSRSPIPNPTGIKNFEDFHWFQHIGVYSYEVKALEKFVKESNGHSTYYEHCEKLEQLRALTMGLTIGAYPSNTKLIGVDNPKDITQVEDLIND